MARTRIFQPIPLALQTRIELDTQASHHLTRVLRANEKDEVTVFNGEGGEYQAVVMRINKKKVTLKIVGFTAKEVEAPITIHLAQGIARGEKMDFIVQKAIELGVHHLIPLVTERCNVRLDKERESKRLQHWQSIAISACEQSGRNQVPVIATPVFFKPWVASAKADRCFVLSPHVQTTLPAETLPAPDTILLLIGPEGGLSPEEMVLAIQQGFLPVNLGPRVLRTETATIAALSVLQYRYGDFS